MAEQKGIGSKLLGLFVEKQGDGEDGEEREAPEAEAGEKSAADLVAELANQTNPAGRKQAPGHETAAPLPPPPNLKLDKMTAPSAVDAKVDFDQIFKEGGLDPAELDRVKKAEDLLKGLPEATPHDVKKQIVEASLRAFGFEVSKIIQAASTQLRALDVFVKANTDLTAKAITDADVQIKQLNDKIAGLRAEIEKRTAQLSQRTTAATARKGEVQRVLDFFGQPPAAAPKP